MNVIQELILPAGDEKPDFEHGSIFFIGTATLLKPCLHVNSTGFS